MFEPDKSGIKLGPLWFTPGYSGANIGTMLLGCLLTMSVITYLGFIQPYLLTEVLKIPPEEQGVLTGNLAAMQEVVVILIMGFAGALSDRTGRRFVFVTGFLVLAAGYAVYPLASSVTQLYIFRLVFATGAGIVPVMLSACIQDHIQERSRARWIGVTSIFNGLGVILMATVLAKTPDMYQQYGADPAVAGRYAFWTATAICLFAAVVLGIGLKAPDKNLSKKEKKPLIKQLKLGVSAGRNPRLSLAFGAAFIGRGDLAIIGTFFSLWVTQTGVEAGMETSAALARGGMLFGIIQLSAMLWAAGVGIISDKFNRISSLCFALGIAAVGYLAMGLVADPFANSIFLFCILLGIGEISVIVSAGALLGQEAPEKIRGSVVGVYGLVGAIGILFATKTGGELFDGVGRTAPLTMMGILNAVLLVIAIWVRIKHGEPTPAALIQEDQTTGTDNEIQEAR